MINPRISAVWSTTKLIAPFSCAPLLQEVKSKAEVVHLAPGLLGLGFYSVSSTTKPIAPFSCAPRLQEVQSKA